MTEDVRDYLHRAVDEFHPDLAHLTTTSRRRGLGIRRRRQALSVVGTAATVTAVVVLGTQLGGSPGRTVGAASSPEDSSISVDPTPSPDPSTPPSSDPSTDPQPEATVPLTGRSTVVVLRAGVADAVNGSADHFAGQGSSLSETYAELRWHPADGSGFSVMGVNVQPAFANPEIYTCRGDFQIGCRVSHPGSGVTLMTYEEHTTVAGGTGIRVVADLLRADGVRVVASSTNGLDLPDNQWQVTRLRPVLERAQLTALVQLPSWQTEVPGSVQTAGERLPGYRDLDEEIVADGSSSDKG